MKTPVFTGGCTALVTPFQNGKLNLSMLDTLLDRQMEAGIGAVVVCGTTGEAPTLSDAEKITLFHRTKEFCGTGCTVIAGTGSNDTRHAVALSQAAEDSGADALLVVSPYYNKATPEGLVAHYLTVAHSVETPIILYNVPSRTGVDIPVSVYCRLAPLPNVAGIKEASKDITKITRTCNNCGDFYVWTGNDEYIVPSMSLGAQGVVSVLSNVVPVETQAMTSAMLAGDLDSAMALQQQLQPLIDILFCEVNPIPVKAAMKYLGYDCGSCRLPLTELSKENKLRLEAYFR